MCIPLQAFARLYGTPPASLASTLNEIANTCWCDLAIGEEGLTAALVTSTEKRPVVAIFITATGFHQILQAHPTNKRVSALFAEADPSKNLALANILLGSRNAVIFYTDSGAYLQNVITSDHLVKTNKETLAKSISKLDRVRAVVAVPDANIWTKDTFRVSVLSLYEQNKVVIGFSKNLVTAGAIASLYFEEIDYLRDLNALISSLGDGTGKSTLSYPLTYQIAINQKVAQSLNITVPDSKILLAEVYKATSK